MTVREATSPSLPVATLDRPRPYHRTEVLSTSREIFDTMLSRISSAKHSIDMQYYSFEADTTGRKVLDACRDAKRANPSLSIRLLIDNSVEYLHSGTYVGKSEAAKEGRDQTAALLRHMQDEGILDVKVTNHFDLKNAFTNSLHLFSNIFHRDHKKLFLVDAREDYPDATPAAIVASANVASYHENKWRDAGRLFEGGEVVRVLEDDFEETFRHAEKWKRVYEVDNPIEYFQRYGKGFLHQSPLKTARMLATDLRGSIVRNAETRGRRIVVSPNPQGLPERDEVVATDSFWRRVASQESFATIKQAKQGDKVTVVTPYPGFFTLTRALIAAAKRGVQVELVIPSDNNHVLYNHEIINKSGLGVLKPLLHKSLDDWEKRLSRNGVGVYKYQGKESGTTGMIHFKGMVLERTDGTSRSVNGSANYTSGIIAGSNREIIVATEGRADTDPMVRLLQDIKEDSVHIPPTNRK